MVTSLEIANCKNGDTNAQRKLYETCAPYIYAIIKSYITDNDFRKDVMQDTFIAIYRNIESYNSEIGRFKSWISQIATHKCIDFLRKNNKISFSTDLEIIEPIDDRSAQLLDQLSLPEIEEMLKDMPAGYKTIFLLNIIDEYSHVEIASMLDITPETSRSQLHRAIQWINKNLVHHSKISHYGRI